MSKKQSRLMKEIKEMQEFIDKRSQVEKKAEKLISECRFEEAMTLMETI